MKAQHEGALTPCIIQKNPQVTNTVRQVVCHPVNTHRTVGGGSDRHLRAPLECADEGGKQYFRTQSLCGRFSH